MLCEEKEHLSESCIAASAEFDAVAQELKAATGFLVDFRARNISWTVPRTLKHRPAEFSRFAEGRRKHLDASSALSLHLSNHRC
jgi:hypothetical protein